MRMLLKFAVKCKRWMTWSVCHHIFCPFKEALQGRLFSNRFSTAACNSESSANRCPYKVYLWHTLHAINIWNSTVDFTSSHIFLSWKLHYYALTLCRGIHHAKDALKFASMLSHKHLVGSEDIVYTLCTLLHSSMHNHLFKKMA